MKNIVTFYNFDKNAKLLRLRVCMNNEKNVRQVESGHLLQDTKAVALLPEELLLEIFKNLDLCSLAACAQVNSTWDRITYDSTLFTDSLLEEKGVLSNPGVLTFYFKRWDDVKTLVLHVDAKNTLSLRFIKGFLKQCCQQLEALYISNGMFITNGILRQIGQCEKLTSLDITCLYKSSLYASNALSALSNLKRLEQLNLSNTYISDTTLRSILRNNPNLKLLDIDNCFPILRPGKIVSTIARYNTILQQFSLNGAKTLAGFNFAKFLDCANLTHLYFGFSSTSPVSSCFRYKVHEVLFKIHCNDRENLLRLQLAIQPLLDLKNIIHLKFSYFEPLSPFITVHLITREKNIFKNVICAN